MKCHGCGHDYPSTLTRCTKCGRQSTRRARPFSDSRLIEFPRQARAPGTPAPETAVPAWRAEVTENVRQMRARRNGESTEPMRQQAPEPAATEVKNASPSNVARPGSRDTKPIVEGALTRIRRANQDASRSGMPAIAAPAAQGLSPKISPGLDREAREATARALEPVDEPQPTSVSLSAELPAPPRDSLRTDQQPKTSRELPGIASRTKAQPARAQAQATPLASKPAFIEPTTADHREREATAGSCVLDPLAAGPLDGFDELDPLDYLSAEVRKVDRALARELARNSTATLFSRLVSGVVDVIVIGLSALPFLVLIQVANGNLTQRSTATVAIGIVVLLSFFYLAFTQCMCGRTFGMMVTNTHIADAVSRKAPTISRSLLRTIGLYVALAPAGIGILWAFFDKDGRGWQDLISGTVVISDF
jgi:uncharacterized RDD family membrane protein YckC